MCYRRGNPGAKVEYSSLMLANTISHLAEIDAPRFENAGANFA
jgi:hypothetical protein